MHEMRRTRDSGPRNANPQLNVARACLPARFLPLSNHRDIA